MFIFKDRKNSHLVGESKQCLQHQWYLDILRWWYVYVYIVEKSHFKHIGNITHHVMQHVFSIVVKQRLLAGGSLCSCFIDIHILINVCHFLQCSLFLLTISFVICINVSDLNTSKQLYPLFFIISEQSIHNKV